MYASKMLVQHHFAQITSVICTGMFSCMHTVGMLYM